MDDRDGLLTRIARLEALVAEQAARIKELERELRRRGEKFTPKANAKPAAPKADRRTKSFRKHPGQTRPAPALVGEIIEHDVTVDQCPDCGGRMNPTGELKPSPWGVGVTNCRLTSTPGG